MYVCDGLLVCWFVDLLVCWFDGLLICWFAGGLFAMFVDLSLVCLAGGLSACLLFSYLFVGLFVDFFAHLAACLCV